MWDIAFYCTLFCLANLTQLWVRILVSFCSRSLSGRTSLISLRLKSLVFIIFHYEFDFLRHPQVLYRSKTVLSPFERCLMVISRLSQILAPSSKRECWISLGFMNICEKIALLSTEHYSWVFHVFGSLPAIILLHIICESGQSLSPSLKQFWPSSSLV